MIQGPSFGYRLFSLNIRSEIELPELFPVEFKSLPDIIVRRGSIARAGTDVDANGDGLQISVAEGAAFRIRGGREIIVDADPEIPERNVRLILLGTVFGALLHQRGMLPLHANAIEVDGRAVAFMGQAGAGKSTLAAWLHARGFTLIADDVCAVGFDETGTPFAAPGLPRLRLWLEALEASGREARGLERSYVNAGLEIDKFDIPMTRCAVASRNVELAGVYLLTRGDQFSVRSLHGIEAADAVFSNTYRGSLIETMKRTQDHFNAAVRFVRTVPVYAVSRRWDLQAMDDQNQQLIEQILRGRQPQIDRPRR